MTTDTITVIGTCTLHLEDVPDTLKDELHNAIDRWRENPTYHQPKNIDMGDWYADVMIRQADIVRNRSMMVDVEIAKYGYVVPDTLTALDYAVAALRRSSLNHQRILRERAADRDQRITAIGAEVTIEWPTGEIEEVYMSFGTYIDGRHIDSFGIADDSIFYYPGGEAELVEMQKHPDKYDFAVKRWGVVYR